MGQCGATDKQEKENETGHHKENLTTPHHWKLVADWSLLPIKNFGNKVLTNIMLVKIQIKRKNKEV